eukprot:TRINITY_DN8485_c0_g1_i1.p1 TRINITY_DN8485_c0_g1~~TRINITY_DN8485_c0_g1_i1.p1  ORF type:complete len:529 (+),score=48.38 TRINITY_DN8485_c0_g1_i1:73-1659(+)
MSRVYEATAVPESTRFHYDNACGTIKTSNNCFIKFLKILCCCPILLWYSLYVYLFPCIAESCRRFFSCCVCACCRFQDADFPAIIRSIGSFRGLSPSQIAKDIVWVPAAEYFPSLRDSASDPEAAATAVRAAGASSGAKAARATTRAREHHPALFDSGVAPEDVAQGRLGNCWLISTFATLAERPGCIEQLFVARSYSHKGKYTVRIFDGRPSQRRWVTVEVDDLLPRYADGRPLFAHPSPGELWVPLLEKAFAKHLGSYAALEGGHPSWALEALTGDSVFSFLCDTDTDDGAAGGKGGCGRSSRSGAWRRWDMLHVEQQPGRVRIRRSDFVCASLADLHDLLHRYHLNGALIAASTGGGDDSQNKDGIVLGHAYSVLKVAHLADGDVRLVQLRNPWGKFEWTGPWGDRSPQWNDHPTARRLLWTDADDGKFWICMEDLVRMFDKLDICDRSTGLGNLHLDVHERLGCCGPCCGCMKGCCCFWCGCRGLASLCCGHQTESEVSEASCCWRNCRCCFQIGCCRCGCAAV